MRVLRNEWFIILWSIFLIHAAWADIYRKIENGQVIFSDTPFAGAQKIELGPINTISGMDSSISAMEEISHSKVPHFQVKIVSPVDGKTYQHGKDIPISYRVEPSMPAQDRTVVLIDGQESGSPVMSGLDRGAHMVEVRILDASDHKIVSSAAHFLVYQHSLFQPHP